MASLRLAIGVVAVSAIYVLAYLHGQLQGGSSCTCRSKSLADTQLPNEEELYSLVPYTERAMIDCLLQKPRVKAALRRRLHTCLRDSNVTTWSLPSNPPALPAIRVLQAPSEQSPAAPAYSLKKEAPAATAEEAVVEIKPDRQDKDPLLRELHLARIAEEASYTHCNSAPVLWASQPETNN